MDGAVAPQVAEFAEALTEVWPKTSHSVVSSVAALMVLQGAPDEAKEGAAWCLRTLSQVCGWVLRRCRRGVVFCLAR